MIILPPITLYFFKFFYLFHAVPRIYEFVNRIIVYFLLIDILNLYRSLKRLLIYKEL